MLQCEVLIFELLPVDALAPSAVAPREVTTLQHELGDDPVEVTPLEAKVLLSGAQGTEVL